MAEPGIRAVGPGDVEVTYRNGEVRRFRRYCPHQGADLSLGYLDDQDRLRCPWHNLPYEKDGNSPCKSIKGIGRTE